MLTRLWSFLRTLFGRPRRAEPPPSPPDLGAPADSPADKDVAVPIAAPPVESAVGEAPVVEAAIVEPVVAEPPLAETPTLAPVPGESVQDEDESEQADEAAPAPALAEETSPLAAWEQEEEEEEEEDEWAGAELEALDDDGEDPFITGEAAEPELTPAETQALREQARAEALNGEHRIHLSSPAGPGTLAEALNVLLEEGLVEAQFVETGEDAPYILYRPAS